MTKPLHFSLRRKRSAENHSPRLSIFLQAATETAYDKFEGLSIVVE
jgi:hypothetical protein